MASRHRVLRTALAAAGALTVAAAGYLTVVVVRHDRTVTLPAPTGPFAVGRATIERTDAARTDPLAPHPGTPRQLSVWLWYPAAPGQPGQPGPAAPYAPGAWAGLHLPWPAGLGQTRFDAVRTHSVQDAAVAPGRFPVVVLEPGLGLAAPQYTALAEHLAGHGYLVAGVTPTYSANLTVLGGRGVTATAAGNPADLDPHADPATGRAPGRAEALLAVWAADARFTAGQVAALDGAGPLAGHVDAGQVVYLGHSFGGAAALQACHDDPRCTGAADVDGTPLGPVVRTGVAAPVLVVGAQNSCVTGTCRPAGADDEADRRTARSLLAAGTGPRWTLTVDGTGHFSFTDYAAYYLAAPLHRLVPLGDLDGGTALTITARYLAAFLDEATRHTAEPLLHGAHPYPQAHLHAASASPQPGTGPGSGPGPGAAPGPARRG